MSSPLNFYFLNGVLFRIGDKHFFILDQCRSRHAWSVCLPSNEMFALSVHDGANVNQLQCRSGSLFLAFALISIERRTLDYDSVHLLNDQAY